ncbi:hypothetical protein [Nonomuraea sp. CA-141351]|uniref:hypothetical protein n=1 Tax=Nonomuraea sp. CA-141351 TaxID=3239996 RepID=UPI003D9288E3
MTGETLRPPAAADQPGQRRKPEPVDVTPPRLTAKLTAKHLVLLTEHRQFNILGQIRAHQHGQQAEQAPHQPVDKRQQHLEMVAAAALITQQKRSSLHATVFPSGTRFPPKYY